MPARFARWLAVPAIGIVALVLVLSGRGGEAGGGITTTNLVGALEPADLVEGLVGGGVTTSNVTFTGADVAAGTFSGGLPVLGSFDSGVILSTGDISFVVGPNQVDDVTGDNNLAGDTDLNALLGGGTSTFDATVLEFDFMPVTDTVSFRFVFASDEYNEFVGSQFNDVFAFYVNGANCAVVPNTAIPVTINSINNQSNPTLYRDNERPDGTLDTEMDGLTVVLTCLASVNQGVNNHIKLAIADTSDDQYDSVVFIQANSLVGSGPGDTNCNTQINSVDALLVLRQSAGLPVNAECLPNGDVNCDGTINSVDALLILRFSASLPVNYPPGCPPIGSGPPPTATPSPSPSGTP
jgi:hypothetical protein